MNKKQERIFFQIKEVILNTLSHSNCRNDCKGVTLKQTSNTITTAISDGTRKIREAEDCWTQEIPKEDGMYIVARKEIANGESTMIPCGHRFIVNGKLTQSWQGYYWTRCFKKEKV